MDSEPDHQTKAMDTMASMATGRIKQMITARRKKKKKKFPHGNPDEHDYRD